MTYLFQREMRYYRKRPIDTLFFLTYRCTSRCKTCTLWQRTDKADEMSLDDWKRTVDMCAEQGATYFEMFGGDALLRPDVLVPLVEYIKSQPGLACDLVTNCNLMTEKMARGLVEARIDDIWISMDGVAEDHNLVRGKERTFNRVEMTIKWMLESRGSSPYPLLHANTTVSNLNYNTFDRVLPYADRMGMDFNHLEYVGEFWDELLDQSIIDGVRPNPYFVRQDGLSVLVNEEQARTIKAKVAQMKKDVRRMNISLQCENVDKLSIKQMISGFCDNRRCYITRGKVTVDPKGNVVGCGFYGDWILGNVRQQHLKDIWNGEKHRQFMKHIAQGNMKICDHCILGVQRNPTPAQNIRDYFNRALGRDRT
ncbi:MAG: radical SAM protein [FCB group bacterium]|nr:radical SAM protein [FCB group bacterium]